MMVEPEHSGGSGSRVGILSLSPDNRHAPGFDSSVSQTQVFSLSSMSHSERRYLAKKLKTELELVEMLLKKIESFSSNANGSMHIHGDGAERPVHRKRKGRAEKNCLPQKTNHVTMMKRCATPLNQLMTQENAIVFNSPVDVVLYNIPDYFDVIKHPMDLGTIRTKLLSGQYSSPEGFAADVRLTFKNAMTYNPPGNHVHLIAVMMRKFFETRWKHVENIIPVTIVEASMPSAKKQKVTVTVEPSMSDVDKRKLEEELEALQEELPEDIVNFLKRSTLNSNGIEMDEDEIAIDIYAISDDTLFKLRKLLDDYKAKKQKNQAKIWPCNLQIQNNSGCSNSYVKPHKGKPCTELAEKDLDMATNDLPISNSPCIEMHKNATTGDGQCNSSSSSDSESSSSSSNGEDS